MFVEERMSVTVLRLRFTPTAITGRKISFYFHAPQQEIFPNGDGEDFFRIRVVAY